MAIEDEIAAVKAAAEKKLRRLRERERKNQQAVGQRVLILLRRTYADLADRLEEKARKELEVETAQRSKTAKASRVPRSSVQSAADDPLGIVDGHDLEEIQ